MALSKDKVDDLLVDFVVRNNDNLVQAKKDNPALYDSVTAALSLLAKRYGSGEGRTSVAPEPSVQPIAPLDYLGFDVGDVFYHEEDKKTKYHIADINRDTGYVEVGFLDRVKGNTKYEIDQAIQYFGTGVWIKTGESFFPTPEPIIEIKEGDIIESDQKKGSGKPYTIVVKGFNITKSVVDFADLDFPDVVNNISPYNSIVDLIKSGRWKIIGNINDAKPAQKPAPAKKAAKPKAKRAVTPEEKEILEAIKTLKPLLEFDADIQLEIDALNQKLEAIRNQ